MKGFDRLMDIILLIILIILALCVLGYDVSIKINGKETNITEKVNNTIDKVKDEIKKGDK